jgi:hypothetical protein
MSAKPRILDPGSNKIRRRHPSTPRIDDSRVNPPTHVLVPSRCTAAPLRCLAARQFSSQTQIDIRDYQVIFFTDVTVFWGFDARGKLIDLWVWKTTDSL